MTTRLRLLAPLLFTTILGTCLAGCASQSGEQTASGDAEQGRVVLVIRHAEKATNSANPSLSEQGKQRAEALALRPEAEGVRTIYTSQFKRTIETAQPLAERQAVDSRVVNASASPAALQTLADNIRASAANGTVLVVGHSNTVPLIIRSLGGPDNIILTDEEYGDLFIITMFDDGTVFMERTRYGD